MEGKVDVPELEEPLRSEGIERIKYFHTPPRESEDNVSGLDHPVTTCALIRDNSVVSWGRAYLHPKDQFCRKTGREVSLRDAVRNLDIKDRR